MLWDEIQSNASYKDKTTLLVLPELGRDGDRNTANGFLNHRSGLLGLSGIGSDMRDIEKAASLGDKRANLTIDIFVYRIRKYIGAYFAALGGLHALAFAIIDSPYGTVGDAERDAAAVPNANPNSTSGADSDSNGDAWWRSR